MRHAANRQDPPVCCSSHRGVTCQSLSPRVRYARRIELERQDGVTEAVALCCETLVYRRGERLREAHQIIAQVRRHVVQGDALVLGCQEHLAQALARFIGRSWMKPKQPVDRPRKVRLPRVVRPRQHDEVLREIDLRLAQRAQIFDTEAHDLRPRSPARSAYSRGHKVSGSSDPGSLEPVQGFPLGRCQPRLSAPPTRAGRSHSSLSNPGASIVARRARRLLRSRAISTSAQRSHSASPPRSGSMRAAIGSHSRPEPTPAGASARTRAAWSTHRAPPRALPRQGLLPGAALLRAG